jgi:hypothetical protein
VAGSSKCGIEFSDFVTFWEFFFVAERLEDSLEGITSLVKN